MGMSLPGGSRLNGVNGFISAHDSDPLSIGVAAQFAVQGWIIPVQDPDTPADLNALWDTFVPKDTDTQTMDIDTGAADATPFWEPGEADWTTLIDVGLKPEKIFEAQRLITWTSPGVHRVRDTETPFAEEYYPQTNISVNVRKNYFIRDPSMVIFACGVPLMDDVTATVESSLAEAEWGQVRYVNHVLERALLHLFGVVEAGAETPWEEATALLQKHLKPNVFNMVANKWGIVGTPQVFESVFARFKFDHSVEGDMSVGTVSLG